MPGQRQHQLQNDLRIDNKIDRVYFNTTEPIHLAQHNSTRRIESLGFDDTVIWNPWRDDAITMTDMADVEYQQMLCIESANVQTPIQLETGKTWQGLQKITIVDESI